MCIPSIARNVSGIFQSWRLRIKVLFSYYYTHLIHRLVDLAIDFSPLLLLCWAEGFCVTDTLNRLQKPHFAQTSHFL